MIASHFNIIKRTLKWGTVGNSISERWACHMKRDTPPSSVSLRPSAAKSIKSNPQIETCRYCSFILPTSFTCQRLLTRSVDEFAERDKIVAIIKRKRKFHEAELDRWKRSNFEYAMYLGAVMYLSKKPFNYSKKKHTYFGKMSHPCPIMEPIVSQMPVRRIFVLWMKFDGSATIWKTYNWACSKYSPVLLRLGYKDGKLPNRLRSF